MAGANAAGTNQISYAYGSLIKTDNLYNLRYPARIAPASVCRNGVMDYTTDSMKPASVKPTGVELKGCWWIPRLKS